MTAGMLAFTEAQADHLVELIVWPTARILAFIATAPLFSFSWLPTLWRLGFGLVCAWAILPALSSLPSWPGMGGAIIILFAQVVIGISLGLVFRFMVGTFELAAGWIAISMGLGFATTISSQYGEQNNTLSMLFEFAVIFFLIADGGMLGMIQVLTESFQAIPIGYTWSSWNWLYWANLGQAIFTDGVLIAIPVVLLLLVVDLGMAIIARIAPQVNIFAIGFPALIVAGFFGLLMLIPYFPSAVNHIFFFFTKNLYVRN
ncbi:flagellar biosynthetic protein FliR [Acidithiobacillus caldus]